MTTEEVRRGGLEVVGTVQGAPIGVDLTDEQPMAIAFRHLADIGFAENMAGHITWQPDGQTDMLVNPWGLWWRELTASDICVVDEDARVVRGRWDVTPAIHLHTELHRLQPDARVVDPQPPLLRQPARRAGHAARAGPSDRRAVPRRHVPCRRSTTARSMQPWRATELVEQIGSAHMVLLANHGVIITGRNIAEAVYRAASIERVCRLAYDVMLTGRTPTKMNRGDMVGHEGVADRAGRRRVLGRRGAHDHQGRPQRAELAHQGNSGNGDHATWLPSTSCQANLNFTTAKTGADRTVTFLPEPERAEPLYTVISVDDHIVEPPDTFEGRVPQKFADRAPRVVDTDDGGQTWMYDGQSLPKCRLQRGRRAAGVRVRVRTRTIRRNAPRRMGHPRTRVKDMDLNGVYASLNFPSFLPGFAGQRLQQVTRDRDLAMASVRAWNDWHIEAWAGAYPERIIPCQLPWLLDPRSRREDDP